ncbi:GNAT family N-acetyltransferase [Saccharothrix sp. Mg75]|uniref:GNAT family N-acetyltransferase n=1 Tax=Saccharothrix sp. Mg75 TaxID=3445357 RepID=UPI003EEF2A28
MAADRRSVEAMLDRCSDCTVLDRCGGGSPDTARLYLRSLPDRSRQTTVAGWHGHLLVGMATAVHDDDGSELAILVEDAWQRRGVGTALMSRLLADTAGRLAVRAQVAVTNTAALALLRRVAPTARLGAPDAGVIEVEFTHAPHDRMRSTSWQPTGPGARPNA